MDEKDKKRLIVIRHSMYCRCYYPTTNGYERYGGRGIKMCDEWINNPQSFYDWAINNGYEEGLSIDRIDVNGNYEPNNCRWVDNKTQSNNRNNNVILEYNNEKHNIKEWCKIINITESALNHRLKRGWDLEKALTTPQRNRLR